jgi:hypothetical protein
MADIFPDAGLDYLLTLFPKNTVTVPTTLYLALFKGGSATTVPTSAATLAAMTGTFAEVTTTDYPGYARVAVAAADWGAPAADADIWGVAARAVTSAQKSFAAASSAATPTLPINGFFICTVPTGTSGVPVYFSNFDDTTGISSLAIGDIVRVTPQLGFAG